MDEIIIRDLEVYAGHGVFEQEKQCGQPFLVDAVLYTDLAPAGIRDDLTCSTDYGKVCQLIYDELRQNTFLLLEAAAEHLAKKVLLAFPLIKELELEIKKPHAPIGLPFGNVSVKIRRGWKSVYLGIGSNMGDKRNYIEKAIEQIKNNPQIRNVRCSQLIITTPYGGVEQDDFLNGALGFETLLSPEDLLFFLHELEAGAGRERLIHWGPRTLDLDILLYQGYVSDDVKLTVPHPDMENRRFVLEPLAQLCPYEIHPITGKSIRRMLQELVG